MSENMKRLHPVAGGVAPLLLGMALVLAGCSHGGFAPRPVVPDDRRPVPKPEERSINDFADAFDNQITRQVEQTFDLSRQLRTLFGRPKQAKNCTPLDEVPNSAWFTNRNGVRRMSLDEIGRGPDRGTGPDTSGAWTVVRAKSAGVTPGFHIEDARGDRYLLKFDPPGYPELATSAEVVSTKLFYAAGYNVPENYIVFFRPERLILAEGVRIKDKTGASKVMTGEDLNSLLGRIEQAPDGSIRAVASKYVPGEPIGPFCYKGTRPDDPNDIVPHQHRRELRGLRVIAAWLHHFDTKSLNSLDTYVTRNGASYVEHYLIDFGSTLGSAATKPVEPFMGRENFFDPREITKSTLALGLYVRASELPVESGFRSVGHYTADGFHPRKYKFLIPNPAFENCTAADGFWAAKIVTSFTDEQLAAAVAEGRYSDRAAEAYLLRGLRERRDVVGRVYLAGTNSLDRFRVERNADGYITLTFEDLAVERGYADGERSEYRYEIRTGERKRNGGLTGGTNAVILPAPRESAGDGQTGSREDAYVEVLLRVRRDEDGAWSNAVHLYLTADEDRTGYTLKGLKRDE